MILFFITLSLVMFLIFMKKFNYDFKGVELIIFWILFTVFTYGTFNYDGLLFIPIVYLALYYLIKLIKTNKCIKWIEILIQFVLSVVFMIIFMNYENAVCEGWCNGSLLLYIIFIAIILYMFFINMITYFLNKKRKIK